MKLSELIDWSYSLLPVGVPLAAPLIAGVGLAVAVWLMVGWEPPGSAAVQRFARLHEEKPKESRLLNIPMIGPHLARVAAQIGQSGLGVTKADLREAGYPFGLRRPTEFAVLQLTLAISTLVLGLVLAVVSVPLYVALLLALVGYLGPAFIVKKRRDERRMQIMTEFPLFLDALHALVTGGGVPPMQGIRQATTVTTGPLRELLQQLSVRLESGGIANLMLTQWARETGIPALQSFAAAYSEAMMRGDDVHDIMSALAEVGRKEREQYLLLQVRKKPVAMTFTRIIPVIIILAVVLWPASLTLLDSTAGIGR